MGFVRRSQQVHSRQLRYDESRGRRLRHGAVQGRRVQAQAGQDRPVRPATEAAMRQRLMTILMYAVVFVMAVLTVGYVVLSRIFDSGDWK